jgi:hypothetical protein
MNLAEVKKKAKRLWTGYERKVSARSEVFESDVLQLFYQSKVWQVHTAGGSHGEKGVPVENR